VQQIRFVFELSFGRRHSSSSTNFLDSPRRSLSLRLLREISGVNFNFN